MGISAYTKRVLVKTTAQGTSLYVALPGTNATLNLAGDVLDDTDFTSTGMRSRIVGLRDWNISISCNYDTGNTGFTNTRSAWFNRTKLDARYEPQGTTKGYQGEVYVETFSHSGDVSGLETVDISLVAADSLSTF